MDTLKVSVPAICYTFQNNLQFVAATHLGAALLQLLYQTKTLSTAIFGVVILSKSLRCNQWCALMVLVCGVVLAQSSQSSGGVSKGNIIIGVSAAMGVRHPTYAPQRGSQPRLNARPSTSFLSDLFQISTRSPTDLHQHLCSTNGR